MFSVEKPKISVDYMLQQEGELLLLFNIKTGEIFKINTTCYDFLNACDGTKTVTEILLKLQERYLVDERTLLQDFAPLVNHWIELKIIV